MILNMITQGGGSAPSASKSRKDINFFDYDGTIVESYTAQEWASVSSLPANPSHDGLVAQGWNYTLAEINTEVSAQGKCDIGQMYVTESGNTEIDIHIADIARNNPYLGIAVNGTAVIDWGDGSATDTVTGTSLYTQIRTQHTYSAAGYYTIKIIVSSGSISFYGTYPLLSNNINSNNSRVFANMVQAIRIGANANIGSTAAFIDCYSLSSITIPNSVTRLCSNMFQNCYSLLSITIPSSVIYINSTNAFYSCYSLSSISLPRSITTVETYTFQNCYSLSSVTIPSSVTSIKGNAFNSCYSLSSIILPRSITSVETYMFQTCGSLSSITIPSSVTSIKNNAFLNCYGMAEYHFESTTPPTLANINAFNNMPSDCIIYVPSASLSAYQSANNWSTYASKMIGE